MHCRFVQVYVRKSQISSQFPSFRGVHLLDLTQKNNVQKKKKSRHAPVSTRTMVSESDEDNLVHLIWLLKVAHYEQLLDPAEKLLQLDLLSESYLSQIHRAARISGLQLKNERDRAAHVLQWNHIMVLVVVFELFFRPGK